MLQEFKTFIYIVQGAVNVTTLVLDKSATGSWTFWLLMAGGFETKFITVKQCNHGNLLT